MVSLEDVRKKVDEKCLIVTNVHIDPDYKYGFSKSSITILCGKDKREYLGAVRWWKRNFLNEIKRLERKTRIITGDEIRHKVWGNLWKDLEPNKDKDILKDIPQLIVQFDNNWYEDSEIEVKGNLDVLLYGSKDETSGECMLVNYMNVDFEEDGLTTDHNIKNKVAILCDKEKQEYLGRLRKWQQEYLPEINKRKNREEFEEWINLHWKNLEPNKTALLDVPNIGVYYLDQFNVLEIEEAITIEVQGEIDHKWYYSEIPWYDIYGEEESWEKRIS